MPSNYIVSKGGIHADNITIERKKLIKTRSSSKYLWYSSLISISASLRCANSRIGKDEGLRHSRKQDCAE